MKQMLCHTVFSSNENILFYGASLLLKESDIAKNAFRTRYGQFLVPGYAVSIKWSSRMLPTINEE